MERDERHKPLNGETTVQGLDVRHHSMMFLDHWFTTHPKEPQMSDLYICQNCAFTTPDFWNVYKHMNATGHAVTDTDGLSTLVVGDAPIYSEGQLDYQRATAPVFTDDADTFSDEDDDTDTTGESAHDWWMTPAEMNARYSAGALTAQPVSGDMTTLEGAH